MSPATKALIETLHRPVVFWKKPTKHKIDTLALIAEAKDPSAIPDIAALLFDPNGEVARTTANTVATLTKTLRPSELKWLDQVMREKSPYRWSYPSAWAELRPNRLARLQKFGADSVFALGLVSFHFSGYVREGALQKLADIEDQSKLPYVILRLNDWVSEVRDVAHRTLRDCIQENYTQGFIDNIVLVNGLQHARREDLQGVLNEIERLLKSKSALKTLHSGLDSPDKETKRLCYKLAFEASEANQHQLVQRALSDIDPIIRLQGVQWLGVIQDAEFKGYILSKARLDRFAPVRRKVLEIVSAQFPDQRTSWLEQALLDRHPSVRGYAQSQLGQDLGFNLRDFYIRALAKADTESLYAAISGLGEIGVSSDAGLVLAYVQNSIPRIRRSSLRTLASLDAVSFVNLFLEKLSDNLPGVSREAMKALSKTIHLVAGDQVWKSLVGSSGEHVQRNALFLIARLSKWESVGYFVQALDVETPNTQQLAQKYLQRWFAQFNSSFTAPSKLQVERLRVALDKSKTKLDRAILEQIEFGIRVFAT